MKKNIIIGVLCCLLALLVSCGENESKNEIDKSEFVTITDHIGREVTLEKEPETIIDPVEMSTDFDSEISIDDDVPVSKTIKATQIVVRTTEKERDQLKAYFMKHGVSLSKGIKIAIKYLEQQEKKGLVHFSDIGLY